MTYCLSDVHGEYDRFLHMLELISFSDEDELFILGDVIDRGEGGVQLLQHIYKNENMHLIMGNHESMMVDCMCNNLPKSRELWHWNGGFVTEEKLMELTADERDELLSWVEYLPSDQTVDVNGQLFYMVHAYPGKTFKEKIWARPTDTALRKVVKPEGAQVIFGHTPSIILGWDDGESPFEITTFKGMIDIDCGCGHFSADRRRLACLRLDDMKDFYV